MPRLSPTLLIGLLSACSVTAAQTPDEPAPTAQAGPLQTAVAFLAAYNDHDIDALLALADDGITWLSVAGDGVEIVARGRASVGEALRRYFAEYPDAYSVIDGAVSSGAFVATREIAYWRDGEERRRQSALGIYEICGARVCRIWYYPAVYGSD